MKGIIMLTNLLIISTLSFAQNILAGTETFDKVRKDGFYTTVNVDQKYIEKDWSSYLSKFGAVQNKKDDYNVANANIPSVSPNPVVFSSKLTGQKGKTTIFCAYDLGSGTMLAQGANGYDGAQKMMQDFYNLAMANDAVRLAQADLDASQNTVDKLVKTGDKISKNIDGNKRDKDKLLKKIDENKAELDQLLKDQINNKSDIDNAKATLEDKRKAIETVRANVPKI